MNRPDQAFIFGTVYILVFPNLTRSSLSISNGFFGDLSCGFSGALSYNLLYISKCWFCGVHFVEEEAGGGFEMAGAECSDEQPDEQQSFLVGTARDPYSIFVNNVI